MHKESQESHMYPCIQQRDSYPAILYVMPAGIPATVVAAASFDDMIAITGYTIFIDIAIKGEGNQVWAIMHGPVSVVLGILAGLIAAYLCAFTKLWNNRVKRTAVVLFSALFMKFIFDRCYAQHSAASADMPLNMLVYCIASCYVLLYPR